MPRRKKPTVSLEEVKARFEEWRRNRKGAPIPQNACKTASPKARPAEVFGLRRSVWPWGRWNLRGSESYSARNISIGSTAAARRAGR